MTTEDAINKIIDENLLSVRTTEELLNGAIDRNLLVFDADAEAGSLSIKVLELAFDVIKNHTRNGKSEIKLCKITLDADAYDEIAYNFITKNTNIEVDLIEGLDNDFIRLGGTNQRDKKTVGILTYKIGYATDVLAFGY